MRFLLIKADVFLISLLLSADPVFSQGKFELAGGFGSPEMVVLKIRYGKNVQIGASQGIGVFSMFSQSQIINGPTMSEIYYHFSGKSRFTEQKPWYLFGSAGYWFGINIFLCCPRIGRSFNLSENTGINIDLGAQIALDKEFLASNHSPVSPSESICYFFSPRKSPMTVSD